MRNFNLNSIFSSGSGSNLSLDPHPNCPPSRPHAQRLILSDPWPLSLATHAIVGFLILYLFWLPSIPKNRSLDVDIIEVSGKTTIPIKITNPQSLQKKPIQRKIFGMSRKSQTSGTGEIVKQGNTTAKTPDQEKLKPSDVDSLPIPSDDYLITKMPKLLSEVHIPYPPGPKSKNIQGAVAVDVLIDSTGKVREVSLVEGPDPELNTAAVNAVQDFKFSPAMIRDQAVSVRIRYTYRFVLEH